MEKWNDIKGYFYTALLSLLIGALGSYFIESKPKQNEYQKRAEELKEKYENVLKAFAVQDSILKIEVLKREGDIKSRDSLSLGVSSYVNKIDSLTRIKIDSNDLNEAIKWLDSIKHFSR